MIIRAISTCSDVDADFRLACALCIPNVPFGRCRSLSLVCSDILGKAAHAQRQYHMAQAVIRSLAVAQGNQRAQRLFTELLTSTERDDLIH